MGRSAGLKKMMERDESGVDEEDGGDCGRSGRICDLRECCFEMEGVPTRTD